MSTIKALKKALAGVMVFGMLLAATPAAAAGLTSEQVTAIMALLSSFGADQATIDNVNAALTGAPVSSGGSTVSTPSTSCSYTFTQFMKRGSRGEEVRQAQMLLNSAGYNAGVVDGIFGGGTDSAVKAFQAANGLVADGLVGAMTRAAMNAACVPANTGNTGSTGSTGGTTTPVDTSGVVSATLSATTPASTALVVGQALADVAHFTLSNGTTETKKVTTMNFQRLGVSNDSLVDDAYLFEGNARLTDSASISNGIINFNDASGLLELAPGQSRTISFRVNVDTGASTGQTFGIALNSFTVMGMSATATSLSGNLHTLSGGVTLAALDFDGTTLPNAAASVDAQENYRIWQNSASVSNEDVMLKGIRFRMRGSADNGDLTNLVFKVNGVQAGSTLASFDGNGYAFFDFMSSPVMLDTGNANMELFADMSGQIASEDFLIEIREEVDVLAYDSELNIAIIPTENSGSFAKVDTAEITVNAGTVTITKTTSSPSGTLVLDASGVTIWEAEVVARGEAVKIESLNASVSETDNNANAISQLDDGAFFLDGVQIGSTQALGTGATTYNFGSSFVAQPGVKHTLQFRADMKDSTDTAALANNDRVQFNLAAGSSNAELMSSGGSYSTGSSTGNSLTIGTGALSLGEDTAYADRTVVPQVLGFKLGDFNAQANSNEAVTITSVEVDFTGNDAADASDDITNLFVKVGDTTSSIRSVAADTNNIFSFSKQVNAGESVAVEIYGDVATSVTDGDGTADTFVPDVTISYSPVLSGGSDSVGPITGQTMTFGTGDLDVSLDGGSPLDRIVASNQEVTVAEYLFDATNDNYTLSELTFTVSGVSSNITNAKLYVDGSQVGTTSSFINDSVTFTGLSVPVEANGSQMVELKFMLNDVGTGAGTSGADLQATLDVSTSEILDGQGGEYTLEDVDGDTVADNTDVAGNNMLAFKSIPTLTKNSVSGGQPSGEKELYDFTVAADSAGNISIKQFNFAVAWTDGGTDTLEVEQFKFYEDGTDITDNVVILDEAGNDIEDTTGVLETNTNVYVRFEDTQETTITGGSSKSYSLRGTFSGFVTDGSSASFQLKGDSTASGTSNVVADSATSTDDAILGLDTDQNGNGTIASFIWSDRSANPHKNNISDGAGGDQASTDWANGYKVLNLDLATEEFTKS